MEGFHLHCVRARQLVEHVEMIARPFVDQTVGVRCGVVLGDIRCERLHKVQILNVLAATDE